MRSRPPGCDRSSSTPMHREKSAPTSASTLLRALHSRKPMPTQNQRLAADQTSSAVQRELWQVALQSARRDPHSTIVPLFIAALNDAINLSTEERAVLSSHIPDVVMIGILLIAFIASAIAGLRLWTTRAARP